jgi:ornithine cyclodeaminase/alanine dehydrogenase
MYVDGLLKDEDIYADLGDIIGVKQPARENDKEIIYFNSVGLAYIDMMFATAYILTARQKTSAKQFACKDRVSINANTMIAKK